MSQREHAGQTLASGRGHLNMKRTFAALALAMMPAACITTTPPTLAELEANRARNMAAATRAYPGRSAEEVRAAAFEVLKLLNPSEMRFDLRSDRLLASQTYWFNMILSASSGQRWYEVVFSPEGDGTRVTLALEEESEQSALIATMHTSTFKQNIAVSSDEALLNNYALFYDRLDYMLGLRPTWPACADYPQKRWAYPLFFCGGLLGGIGIADQAPVAPVSSPPKPAG